MSVKNALLIGASGGLGKYISSGLAAKGINLALHCNDNPGKLDPLIAEIENSSVKYKIYKANIVSEAEVANLVNEVKSEFGSIDLLINNAGVSINAMSWKLKLEDWSKVLDVNLTGPFLCTKHVLPFMKENKFGRIVYMSSVVPQIGVAGTAAYAASKSGLFGLCKTISKEVIKNNITANVISLGYFDAGMLYQIPEEIRNQIKDTIPIKEFGNPLEIVECISYLCAENSKYITGQTINLNGGLF